MSRVAVPTGRAAMATLISTEGGSPRPVGSRMWVDAEGAIVGSVTIGGCVDARVIEAAARAIDTDATDLLSMALGDDDAWSLGMTCAGTIEVLIEPVDGDAADDPVAAALRSARDRVTRGDVTVLVARLTGARQRLIVTGAGVHGTLGDRALDAAAARQAGAILADGASGVRAVTANGRAERLYFERHAPPLTLVVVGATHVAVPLVQLAAILGLRTVVVDGRDRFATRARFPAADELLVGMPSDLVAQLPLGTHALVVVLAHDYKYDLPVLRAVLATNAAFIGVLGSRRRGVALFDALAADGASPEQLARIHVPVGLDIGARTAEEIALSVLAEALAVVRHRPGRALRDRHVPAPRGEAGAT